MRTTPTPPPNVFGMDLDPSRLIDRIEATQRRLGVERCDVETERATAADVDPAVHAEELRATLLALEREGEGRRVAATLAAQRRRFVAVRDAVIEHIASEDVVDARHCNAAQLTSLLPQRNALRQRKAALDAAAACAQRGVPASENHWESDCAAAQRSWGADGRSFSMQCFDVLPHYACANGHIETTYRCFGRLRNGRSACVAVQSFESYFYASVPDDRAARVHGGCGQLAHDLNAELMRRLEPSHSFTRCRRHGCRCAYASEGDGGFAPRLEPCVVDVAECVKAPVRRCEVVLGRSLVGYHPSKQTFLRVVVAHPFLVARCASLVRAKAADADSLCFGMELHESNLSPVARFMVDLNIVGCGWLDVERASIVPVAQQETRCDLECRVDVANVRSRPDATENAPFRTLAIDIECMALDVNVFPTADKCPVIQMSAHARRFGQPEHDRKLVFCLGHQPNNTHDNPEAWRTDNATDGGSIIDCPNEAALLHAIYRFVLAFDPDILTGYNSNKRVFSLTASSGLDLSCPLPLRFDFPYLFERADTLGLSWFRNLTKVKDFKTLYYKQTFSSAQMGTKESIHYVLPGRITMDVFELIKTNYQLRAYNLNAVSKHFLGDQKDDMDYKLIPKYQRESSQTRGLLAKYCMQDTVLVSNLMDKLQLLTNNIEMARVVGVRMLDVWERGQSFKILRKLLQYTKPRDVFVPTYQRNDEGHTYVPYYDSIDNPQMQRTDRGARQATLDFSGGAKRKRPATKAATGRTIAFQGATVLEPTVGMHKNPTCVLDFASLYPSIMRFWNLRPV